MQEKNAFNLETVLWEDKEIDSPKQDYSWNKELLFLMHFY